jgi:hypothetical protein
MSRETMHEVKSAAAVLADDVICQSFIQSSSTLAYACLLIRRKRYDLALHVLHSLEAKQASRFKDMVFYLQAQIGIETGDFAVAKKRLVPRVHQHPNDMVALSLLECCIHLEWLEWSKANPSPEPSEPGSREMPAAPAAGQAFGNAEAASAAAMAASLDGPAPEAGNPESAAPARSQARPVNHFAASDAIPAAPKAIDPKTMKGPVLSPSALEQFPESAAGARPVRSTASSAATSPDKPAAARVAPASGGSTGDVGIYQTSATDPNTQALAVWNAANGKSKTACRNPELEPLVASLPQSLPASLQAACSALEGGVIHKICCCFQNLTVTSFHAGPENLGLVTGNINQSLLTIVRAENTFRKQTATSAAAPRSPEPVPNE